ncbi:hypothetical protein N602_31190, partial [Mycobacterium avium subsp. hominissuis 10-5606]
QLYVLDRSADAARQPEFDLHTIRIHARSQQLRTRPSVVFATERMDADPRWRLLEPGELVHVDAGLRVHPAAWCCPDPPRQLLRRDELSTPVRDSQHALPDTRRAG